MVIGYIKENHISKEHKRIVMAYNRKMKLKRMWPSYDGEFYYHCIDEEDNDWVLQPHEITNWI